MRQTSCPVKMFSTLDPPPSENFSSGPSVGPQLGCALQIQFWLVGALGLEGVHTLGNSWAPAALGIKVTVTSDDKCSYEAGPLWVGLAVGGVGGAHPVSRVLGLLSRSPPCHIRWPGLLCVILLDVGSLVHLLFGTGDSFTTYCPWYFPGSRLTATPSKSTSKSLPLFFRLFFSSLHLRPALFLVTSLPFLFPVTREL